MQRNHTVLLNADGTVNMEAAVFFSRPYPIATAGTPIKVLQLVCIYCWRYATLRNIITNNYTFKNNKCSKELIYLQLSFDVWKKTFRYEFHGKRNENHLMNKKFPTEIFVPKIHFPNKQYIVKTSRDITWRLSPDNENVLQLYQKPSIFTNQISTSSSFITITPKKAWRKYC